MYAAVKLSDQQCNSKLWRCGGGHHLHSSGRSSAFTYDICNERGGGLGPKVNTSTDRLCDQDNDKGGLKVPKHFAVVICECSPVRDDDA